MLICFFVFQGLSILLQNNGTLVLLFHIIILNILALCRNEISGPIDGLHEVINANIFCFCGTFRVELLFCGANIGKKIPTYKTPPECPLILGWTVNDASTHHIKIPLQLALRVSEILRVPLMYRIICTKLSQSSLLVACTLVVRNVMDVQVSGLAILVAYKCFATRLWKSTTFS